MSNFFQITVIGLTYFIIYLYNAKFKVFATKNINEINFEKEYYEIIKDPNYVININKYYDVVADSYFPGTDASNYFGKLGASYTPMTIFSTGAWETDSKWSGAVKTATFENAVPLIYENAQYNFMSVVGVALTGNGTSSATSVSGFAPSGKYALAPLAL